MTRIAGEVADGVIIHPFSNEKYIREVTLPAVEEGLKRSGRSRENFEIIYSPFIISGKDERNLRSAKNLLRRTELLSTVQHLLIRTFSVCMVGAICR